MRKRKPVKVLRKGRPFDSWQCDCCSRWVPWISERRGWCAACEKECRQVGQCLLGRYIGAEVLCYLDYVSPRGHARLDNNVDLLVVEAA